MWDVGHDMTPVGEESLNRKSFRVLCGSKNVEAMLIESPRTKVTFMESPILQEWLVLVPKACLVTG